MSPANSCGPAGWLACAEQCPMSDIDRGTVALPASGGASAPAIQCERRLRYRESLLVNRSCRRLCWRSGLDPARTPAPSELRAICPGMKCNAPRISISSNHLNAKSSTPQKINVRHLQLNTKGVRAGHAGPRSSSFWVRSWLTADLAFQSRRTQPRSRARP